MRARRGLAAGVLGIVVSAVCVGLPSAAASVPAWTTYHHDGARSGVDPDSTSPVAPTLAWRSAPLDGKVYGQPLVYGSRVYVATENDSVYALDAATGTVVWRNHLATPVTQSVERCTPIWPSVGITGTPVIDPATGRIYVVADAWDGSEVSSISHEMFALNLGDGSVAVGPVRVDAPGSLPVRELQRVSLALAGGRLFMGYGSYDDCGLWHGYVVGVSEDGSQLQSFEIDSGSGENGGSVWASGNAPAVDASGNVWVATGNGSSTTWDFQESVIDFSSSTLGVLGDWAPLDWMTLDGNDFDIGSSMPLVLPDGLVFQVGKQGVGYLLRTGALGGVAPPLYRAAVCDPAAGSWGGGIYYGGVIYVACQYGMHAVWLNAASGTFARIAGWNVDPDGVGPPIEAGGLVWSADYNNGLLVGIDPRTGNERFSINLGGFEHFTSPSAAGGRLFVANTVAPDADQITAFKIANPPPPSSTTTSLGSAPDPAGAGQSVTLIATVSPAPDAGTVTFADGGSPVAGCGAVTVSVASGQAVCTTVFRNSGAHPIQVTYSGDPYYLSSSGALVESITAPAPGPPTALPAPAPGPPAAIDALAISHLHVTVVHRRLRLSLTLSERAQLTAAVVRCLPRRCQAEMRLSMSGHQGHNRFAPRMPALAPGRYRIRASARDAAGRRSKARTVIVLVRR